ncbi:putative large terminase subunit [Escherichia coli p0305293.4]|nr:putative large terminase subunit [Escherichia coli p0305293.4]
MAVWNMTSAPPTSPARYGYPQDHTSSGRSATYEASRSEEASHADLAWATMHALLNEPLTAGISTPLTSTILEFY